MQRVGDGSHLLDVDPIDLLHLLDEQADEVGVGELHDQLVDGAPSVALEDVDADDLASHGTDARRDLTQGPGPVGQPHAHDEGLIALLHGRARYGGCVNRVLPAGDKSSAFPGHAGRGFRSSAWRLRRWTSATVGFAASLDRVLDRAVKASVRFRAVQRRLTQRGEERKAQLMTFAATRFAEQGYHPTSVVRDRQRARRRQGRLLLVLRIEGGAVPADTRPSTDRAPSPPASGHRRRT